MTETATQVPDDLDVYPPEQSMSGKNAYYLFCENEHAYRGYAVCLHTIKAIEEDRLKPTDCVGCQRAIAGGYCPANKMRGEEREAEQALYFVPRRNLNPANTRSEREAQRDALKVSSSGKYDMSNASYARGWAMAGGDPLPKKVDPALLKSVPTGKAVPKPKPKPGFVEESFADVVNAIQKDEKTVDKAFEAKQAQKHQQAQQSKAAPAPTQTLKPMPGETPIEFARRRAAFIKSQQA